MILHTMTWRESLWLVVFFLGNGLFCASGFTHAALGKTKGHLILSDVSPISTRIRRHRTSRSCTYVSLQQSSDNTEIVADDTRLSAPSYELVMLTEKVEKVFPKGDLLIMTLKDHRPLGCTVEESLNEEDDYVFISKLTEGGNADKAGLKVGDVVVGVTGLFEEVTIVMDSGLEQM
jgi:predicted metalloprotease with PDZ domain